MINSSKISFIKLVMKVLTAEMKILFSLRKIYMEKPTVWPI